MVAKHSHRKNRSNSYIITKKWKKNYYLKKKKLKKKENVLSDVKHYRKICFPFFCNRKTKQKKCVSEI